MRKKLIAAVCVQLAAVVFILCYSDMIAVLMDKNGKEISLPCGIGGCQYEIDTDREAIKNYYIDFYEYSPMPDGLEKQRAYKDNSENGNIVGLQTYRNYINDPEAPDYCMDLWGQYTIEDRTVGDRLYRYFRDHSEFSPQFYMNNDVRANLIIYRSRVKLVSVTVNGMDVSDYFSDPAHPDFE